MIKNLSVFFIALLIISCNNINNKELDISKNIETKINVQETIKPTVISSPIVDSIKEQNDSKLFKIQPPDKINILPKIELKMEYPYDIEVSKDGKTIYFKNWYNYPKANDDYLDERIPEQYEKELKRRVIFKFDLETRKIELAKIGDDPLIYNELGQEMELDNEGNLYVNIMNHYINNFRYRNQVIKSLIYKVSPLGDILNRYNVHEIDENKYPVSGAYPALFNKFSGPINLILDKDTIYYAMFMSDTEREDYNFQNINKLNLNTNQISLLYKRNWTYNGYERFFINDNLIFTFLGASQAVIYSLIKKEFISDDKTKWETNLYPTNVNSNDTNKYKTIESFLNNSIKKNSKNDIFSLNGDFISKHNLEKKTINKIGIYPYGFKDGKSNDASFDYPSSLSIDKNDNVYIADTGNNAIRKISSEGEVTTIYKEEIKK